MKITFTNLFFHQDKMYLMFKQEGNKWDFILIQNNRDSIRSILYGENLFQKVENIRANNADCIECNLGGKIEGGISLDSGELVEFGLDKNLANSIVDKLNNALEREDNGKDLKISHF